MATKIGSLFATLSINSEAFGKGLRQADKYLAGFSNRVSSAITGIGGIVAGISGVAVVESLRRVTKESMAAMDATSKLSRNLGIATESLVGLQHAADLAGVEQAALETSLRKMVDGVAEASRGTGSAQKAFQRLGLNARALVNLPVDEQLLKIADAMAAVANPTERLATTMDIFGLRSGSPMLSLFEGGAVGIREMVDEAKRLGIAFDRVSGRKIEEANDAITRAKAVLTALGNSLAVILAPITLKLAEEFTKWATESNKVAKAVQSMFDAFVTGAATTNIVLDHLKTAYLSVKAVFVAGNIALAKSFERLTAAIVTAGEATGALEPTKLEIAKGALAVFRKMLLGAEKENERMIAEAQNAMFRAATGKGAFDVFRAVDEAKAEADRRAREQIRAEDERARNAANAPVVGLWDAVLTELRGLRRDVQVGTQ